MSSTGAPAEVVRHATAESLVGVMAKMLAAAARAAIDSRGRFRVALTGGRSPQPLHRHLASEWRDSFPWTDTEVYFGDERCVPPDHELSNYRAAHEALLAHVPVPAGAVHRMKGELSPEGGATDYESLLRAEFGASGTSVATLDVLFLGVGDDGHTASLFPGSLALEERLRWVTAVDAPTHIEPPVPRVTLTLPMLNSARELWVLFTGERKRQILAEILAGDARARDYPVTRVLGVERTLYFTDRE